MLSFLKKLFGLGTINEELTNAIKDGAMLVDVRTKEEFSLGSVNNAVNIPLNNITDNLDKFKNQENVIVFCGSGNRSLTAKRILQQNKIKNVVNGGSWRDVKGLVE